MSIVRPGDLLLVRTRGGGWTNRVAGWVIRLGAGLSDSPNAWNHVIIAHHVDAAGTFWGVEGRPGGTGWVDIKRWVDDGWTITNRAQPKDDNQRATICDGAKAMIGTSYDWVGIAADAGQVIAPLWRRGAGVPWKDGLVPAQIVCSSLADYLYERAGLQTPKRDRTVTPGDWAELIVRNHWNVP